MLSHLSHVDIPDMTYSGQPRDMPESPCLGLLPSFVSPHSLPLPQEESSWGDIFFKFKPVHLDLISPPPPPWGSDTLATVHLAQSPRTRYQKTKNIPCGSEPTKIFELADPKPAHFASVVLLEEITMKPLAYISLLPSAS